MMKSTRCKSRIIKNILKTFYSLSICVYVLFVFSSAAYSQDAEGETSKFSPEDTAWIYAYGGYGFSQWLMTDLSQIFGDDTAIIKFKHDANPYIVKRYGVKSNIAIFSLGFDYFSDRFSFLDKLNNEDDSEESKDKKRDEQFKYLSGLKLGDYTISATALHRNFNSRLTFEGHMDTNDNAHPAYYYKESGDYSLIYPGNEINWKTTYTEYAVKVFQRFRFGSYDFGIKYKEFNSPTVIGLPGLENEAIMFTRNKYIDFEAGFKSYSNLFGDFYLQTYLPLCFGLYFAPESSYFKLKDNGIFNRNTFPISANSNGTISLVYLLRYLKLETGLDYGYSMINTRPKAIVQKEMKSLDGGTVLRTYEPGEEIKLDINRVDLYWGYFLKACIYF